jgi:hypothetical protein
LVGAGQRRQADPGREHRRGARRVPAHPVEEALQGVDARRHRIFKRQAVDRRLPPEPRECFP